MSLLRVRPNTEFLRFMYNIYIYLPHFLFDKEDDVYNSSKAMLWGILGGQGGGDWF